MNRRGNPVEEDPRRVDLAGERSRGWLYERFQALASTYLFEPCFARPGEGHDKGVVHFMCGAGSSDRLS